MRTLGQRAVKDELGELDGAVEAVDPLVGRRRCGIQLAPRGLGDFFIGEVAALLDKPARPVARNAPGAQKLGMEGLRQHLIRLFLVPGSIISKLLHLCCSPRQQSAQQTDEMITSERSLRTMVTRGLSSRGNVFTPFALM